MKELITFALVMTIFIYVFYQVLNKKVLFDYPPREDPLPDVHYGGLPKIIWTYWHSNLVPELVAHCFDRMKKYNPEWSMVILNPKNVSKYIDDDIYGLRWAKTPQKSTDFIRISLLEKYGGVWLDATLLVNTPLDWLYNFTGYEFIGYYFDSSSTKKNWPIVENWFLACTTGCRFVALWKEEFWRINDFDTLEDYIQNLKDQGVDLQKVSWEYLVMHMAAQQVLQKRMTFGEIREELYLMRAEDGPFKYQAKNEWDTHKTLLALQESREPLVKFIGSSRDDINNSKELMDLVKTIPSA